MRTTILTGKIGPAFRTRTGANISGGASAQFAHGDIVSQNYGSAVSQSLFWRRAVREDQLRRIIGYALHDRLWLSDDDSAWDYELVPLANLLGLPRD